ncbi:MAG TPA: beta-propeller fold lactonase family protein [Candidatus Angelobacter sp.]|jgi:6-phosphogluconolactonase (cycloisomerase 2 family)
MKAFIATILFFVIFLLSGCLGSSGSSTAPTLAFVYVVGTGDNSIRAFEEKTIGDLALMPIASFATNPRPVAIALHPSKNFLYVPNQTSNTVSGFSIDHVSGVLTPIGTAVPPTPACAAPAVCANPIGIGINSSGQFLFLLNQGSASPAIPASISVFSIDTARGLLAPVAGSPFQFASLSAPNPQFLTVSPNAGFLYVSNGTAGTISGFSIGANGTLAELAGSPFPVGAGATVAGLTIDSKGQFLYAADSANNKIASFSISGGVLAAVAGSPFSAGTTPVSVALDSTASFLYSANKGSNDVSAYKVSSGVLTQLPGSPFAVIPTGSIGIPQPSFLTVDVTNTFLYVADFGSSNISVFGRAPDGTLGLITDSPFPLSVAPLWIVSTQ